MEKGGVMPVGSGWGMLLMGEAAARVERAAMRSDFVYILVVGWGLAAFWKVVDFDVFASTSCCLRQGSNSRREFDVVGIDGEESCNCH
jgi:hypothetical protein